MLRDGPNADEENQDADDVGLEPQDRIGVHRKPLHARFSSRFPHDEKGTAVGLRRRRHPLHRESFRAVAVTAPPTEIFDQPLSEREWRLAPASAVRLKLVVRKATRSRSSRSAFVVASEYQQQRRRGNILNSSDVC
jgi:hypothetical protein